MKTLVINNIGPIKHVEIDLKRVNIIIGPQSAGKSCILKIACFCAWAEKRIQLEQGKNGFADTRYLNENLIDFHKLGGFFEYGRGASFRYVTDHLWFEYHHDSSEFNWDWRKSGHWKYKRSKVSYIPAERNIIATIPNWMEVSMGFDYVRNFITDWNIVRQYYDKRNNLEMLSLGIKYYYDRKSGNDYIVLEDGKEIAFTNGSSGLQSAIPMMAYLDFLFSKQYKGEQFGKIAMDSENEDILNHIYDKKFKRGMKTFLQNNTPFIGKIGMGKRFFRSEEDYLECKKLMEFYTKTWHSDIYLEEPEQNLFPKTQIELVYSIIERIKIHEDSLFIATHSPFILFAVNNCILGGLVGKNVPDYLSNELTSSRSWILPSDVSVYEITTDGTILSLQDEEGLLEDNYLNKAYQNVSNEFATLLSFYSYAEKNK